MKAAAAEPEPPGVAPFPWREAMHAGLCLLRLEPAAFWSLTPAEFAAMTGQFGHSQDVLKRSELAALMALYPD
ncbi:rcc01693 family protein [Martelella alba]|nr:rcc01693 family protein [Martelella alba]